MRFCIFRPSNRAVQCFSSGKKRSERIDVICRYRISFPPINVPRIFKSMFQNYREYPFNCILWFHSELNFSLIEKDTCIEQISLFCVLYRNLWNSREMIEVSLTFWLEYHNAKLYFWQFWNFPAASYAPSDMIK